LPFTFRLLGVRERASDALRGVVQLVSGDWDDYSFKTSFQVIFIRADGHRIDLGSVKIGYIGQTQGWTREKLTATFDTLPEGWFSLGQDVDYYKTAMQEFSDDDRTSLLSALRDVAANEAILSQAQGQKVFVDSLLRGVSLSSIRGQYRRVLNHEVELSDFQFAYSQNGDEKRAEVKLQFKVDAGSSPSTNVHVLIGRNGVGKTTLLNNMVGALLGVMRPDQPPHAFFEQQPFGTWAALPKDYFSSVVSVSFSAFDPFVPPADRQDRTQGLAYFYVGMKKVRSGQAPVLARPPKTESELVNDFVLSFGSCLSQPEKRARWRTAMKRLESDLNFAEMDLSRLLDMEKSVALIAAKSMAERMSSGHSIVLLTMTKLVDTVEEKTLVLLDEPESHLHPPLLSAFTRALSDLLHSRNGVAIIATHSPVVLQEVPASCVWKLTRTRAQGRVDRPERETFGENVGVLTREVFGLEVAKSGFHEMLEKAVEAGGTFDSILNAYNGQLGAEARAILLSLTAASQAHGPSQP
jgi:predicted ATPase